MTNTKVNKLSVRETVVIPLLAALMFLSKILMSGLPNIEPISLLIFVYTDIFKKKTLFIIAIYVFLEGLTYGFGSWWICYLYVWPLLFLLAYCLKGTGNRLIKAAAGAIFGLVFGALCSIPYFFIGGISYGVSYFISGIPFDLLHCGGNFLMILLLYPPLSLLFKRLPIAN